MSPWHQHTARMKELSRARVWCRLVSLHTLGEILHHPIKATLNMGSGGSFYTCRVSSTHSMFSFIRGFPPLHSQNPGVSESHSQRPMAKASTKSRLAARLSWAAKARVQSSPQPPGRGYELGRGNAAVSLLADGDDSGELVFF